MFLFDIFKRKEKSLDNIIPSGNGGINAEGRTLKEICQKPIPSHLINKINKLSIEPVILVKIKSDLDSMGTDKVPPSARNGHVDFSKVAWPGICPKLPKKNELIAAIRRNHPNISTNDICAFHVREVTYFIGRKKLADKYGITISQAGKLIGLLDLVIHETEKGRIEIVPNNLHRFKQLYSHKGYVSIMLKEINGKEDEG